MKVFLTLWVLMFCTWVLSPSAAQTNRATETQDGLSLAVSLLPDAFSTGQAGLAYRSESFGDVLRVLPGPVGFMDHWRGTAPISTSARLPGGFGGQATPVPFLLQLENRAIVDAQVIGMYAQVEFSNAQRQPVFRARRGDCTGDYAGTFSMTHLSGAAPLNARIVGDITGTSTRASLGPYAAEIRNTWPVVTLDFRTLIGGFGGNLPGLLSEPVDCQGLDAEACFTSLRDQGAFGELSNFMYHDNACLMVGFTGSFEYEWVDQRGDVQSTSHAIEADIRLGRIGADNLATLAMAAGVTQMPDAMVLVPGSTSYRVPLVLTAEIESGEAQRWSFNLEAPESVDARFHIVMQLADGREIRSREVDLSYYHPDRIPN